MAARRRVFAAASAFALAMGGCTTAPPREAATAERPPDVAAAPAAVSRSTSEVMARQRKLADAARAAGDLATALAHLEVLAVLAPDDALVMRDLAQLRAAIESEVREQYRIGHAAVATGDLERAHAAMLRVLALDPRHEDAATALREIDRQRLTRIQANRVARLNGPETPDIRSTARGATPRAATAPDSGNDTFAVDQALELLRAGDARSGLRDLEAYVAANPTQRAARQRIGAAVAEHAQDRARQGRNEEALDLYEQASALRGDAGGAWVARIAPLRRKLSQEYFDKGTRAFRTNLAQSIAYFEASVRFDPANSLAALKLAEAKAARNKLERIK